VSTFREFRLPDVGEGLTEAEILRWAVAPGDQVEINQVIVEVETAKAVVELPSPFQGAVATLHAEAGETVEVGKTIITIETAAAESHERPSEAAAEETSEKLLVGYGPRGDRSARRRASGTSPAVSVAPEPNVAAPLPQTPISSNGKSSRPLAKPPVRRLAKDLGVDLGSISATGQGGTISRDDVQRAAAANGSEQTTGGLACADGRETRIPVRGVRKHTAAAMVASAFTAPHVTEFVTVDITETMALRDRIAARREFNEARVSPLLFVARALMLAIRRTPEINSSWDELAQEIVVKHYVNLGIAAATERGLVVPNIRDADGKSLLELAKALAELTRTARAGKTSPAEMSQGTITITNVGVFGVDTGTPILNPGEAAILALGAVRRTPWVVTGADGEEHIEPRWVTQLALSFDHRIVDGQQGSTVLADIAAVLQDPGLAML
jgi:pyruvate dehydrogenase E2 component (dihydrolipoamide acetyltransferase)